MLKFESTASSNSFYIENYEIMFDFVDKDNDEKSDFVFGFIKSAFRSLGYSISIGM